MSKSESESDSGSGSVLESGALSDVLPASLVAPGAVAGVGVVHVFFILCVCASVRVCQRV